MHTTDEAVHGLSERRDKYQILAKNFRGQLTLKEVLIGDDISGTLSLKSVGYLQVPLSSNHIKKRTRIQHQQKDGHRWAASANLYKNNLQALQGC